MGKKVFLWPSRHGHSYTEGKVTDARPAWLVGWSWQGQGIVGCIVGLVDGSSYEVVEAQVERVRRETSIWDVKNLKILGALDGQASNRNLLSVSFDSRGHPSCPGVSFVYYDPPDEARYRLLSLKPLELAEIPVLRQLVSQQKDDILHQAIDRSKQSFAGRLAPQCHNFKGVEIAIRYANQASLTDLALNPVPKARFDAQVKRRLLPCLARSFVILTHILASQAQVICPLINYNLITIGTKHFSLVSISSVCRQLDLRLKTIEKWPMEIANLRMGTAKGRAAYVNFYNSLWLLLNDFIVGRTLSVLIILHSDGLADICWIVAQNILVQGVRETVNWLNSWPAGLKLNDELGSFLASLFIFMTYVAEDVLTCTRPWARTIILFFGGTGFVGASFLISALADLLSLGTFHLWIFYMMMVKFYRWQVTLLSSLLQIFRGKRKNVLRQRIDSCEYDLDQLLLSTILSVLLAFLFPTILVYYMAFAVSRIAQVAFLGSVESLLIFLNQFPLFPILLTVKDPARLPYGISFRLIERDDFGACKDGRTSVISDDTQLRLESLPMTRHTILQAFFSTWYQRSMTYTPHHILSALLQGRIISLRHRGPESGPG